MSTAIATHISPEDFEADPRAICVFCASNPGIKNEYREAAESLGEALAQTSHPLVYGGGDRGLMGVLSAQVISSGGNVTGVLPRAMVVAGGEGTGKVENTHAVDLPPDTHQFKHIVVTSMHERKTLMAKIAGGGFMALPGGFGTFEEVLEMITWSQIGIHQKPMVLLNVLGFWEPLRDLIDNAVKEEFIQRKNRALVIFVDPPVSGGETFNWGQAAVEALENWETPSDAGLFSWKET
ncbi:hypothetical protein FRB94_006362 [Tulasnella sp. JGI-2019a]|nr:hypothetical protein FRB94_006362 [Tulasnella sp. JGI-2019a]KAG9026717.1 hypothetical protein FRB95_008523 [Tulasnella sp. JGI-2019a]